MPRLLPLIITAVLLIKAFVGASPFRYVIHERRLEFSSARLRKLSPANFARRTVAPPDIVMRIALKHENLDLAEQAVMDISDPGSPRYGQHWTVDRVSKEFAASDDAINAVQEWLTYEGFPSNVISLSTDRSWIKVRTSLSRVASLLKTEYHLFEDIQNGQSYVACDTYQVPDSVHPYIDFITPTIQLVPQSLGKRSQHAANSEAHLLRRMTPLSDNIKHKDPEDLSNCEQAVTPACIRALYRIPQPSNSANPNNSLGIVELNPIGQYSQIDLDLFFSNFSKSLVGKPPNSVSIDGGDPRYTQNFTYYDELLEADMDLELAMSLANPLNVSIYSVGDQYHGGSFDLWLDALDSSYCTFQGGDDPSIDPTYPDNFTAVPGQGEPYNHPEDCGTAPSAYVYSLSLASIEQVDPSSVGYHTRMCTEFMKLTLQGSTFLFASDDYGVGGPLVFGCGIPDNPPGSTVFTPAFPATCPWVTAVGGSAIDINKTVHDPEVSYALSGGGFSNVFPMPSYQKDAILHWFNHTSTGYPAGTFNDSRQARGIPDLAANAVNTVVASNGAFGLAGGTSASVGRYLINKKLQNDYG